jgi:hypothetical protein
MPTLAEITEQFDAVKAAEGFSPRFKAIAKARSIIKLRHPEKAIAGLIADAHGAHDWFDEAPNAEIVAPGGHRAFAISVLELLGIDY